MYGGFTSTFMLSRCCTSRGFVDNRCFIMAWLIDGGGIFAYFVSVIGIGLYKGRGDKTMEGFAVGGRSIPWWAGLAAIPAAGVRAATFLGAPDEGYASRNYTYAQLAIGTVLARVVVAFVFIKPYYDFRVVSIYEFLRVRFGERTKNGASAVFLITRALASGTRLYVAAVVLVLGYEMFSGVALAPLQQVWIYIGSLVLLTAATAIYTALGGIKAGGWADVIQATVMFGSLAFAIWSLLHAIPDGWQGAMAVLDAPKDLIFSIRVRSRMPPFGKMSARYWERNTPSGLPSSVPLSSRWPRTAPIRTWCSGC